MTEFECTFLPGLIDNRITDHPITLSIIPSFSVDILSTSPAITAGRFRDKHISARPEDWHTRGIDTIVKLRDSSLPIIDFFLHPHPSVAGGVALRVAVLIENTRTHWFYFPPHQFNRGGLLARLNLISILKNTFNSGQFGETQLIASNREFSLTNSCRQFYEANVRIPESTHNEEPKKGENSRCSIKKEKLP